MDRAEAARALLAEGPSGLCALEARGPAQGEGVGEDELAFAGEQVLAERGIAVQAAAVGARGVDGPDLLVHREQPQVHARQAALLRTALAAAALPPHPA